MSKTAQELRSLAMAVSKLVEHSPCFSIISGITATYIDHLSAIAHIHELQEKELCRERQIDAQAET